MRSLMIVFLTQYCLGDQIEKNVMDEACSTYGEWRGVYRVLVGKHEGKRHLEDPGVDEWIILRLIFRKCDVEAWTGSIWLRIGTGTGTCKCGNEPSGSIRCGEFFRLAENRLASQEGLCSME
jgi:hypothetical protein